MYFWSYLDLPQHGVLERPKIRERIIGMILEGKTDAQIAVAVTSRTVSVTRRAIGPFRERHADRIQAAIDEAASRVVDLAITDRAERIRRLSQLYDDVDEYQQEHTLAERSLRYDKDGNEVGETVRFAGAIVAAKQSILRDVRDELTPRGERPTGTKGTLELDNGDGRKVTFTLELGTDGSRDDE